MYSTESILGFRKANLKRKQSVLALLAVYYSYFAIHLRQTLHTPATHEPGVRLCAQFTHS